MTIPNVTVRWCRKQPTTCKWCNQRIGNGTAMVVVYFWNKGNPENRSWNKQSCYHPQCWVEQGLDYLSRNPYVPPIKGKRGRKSLLCEEDRRKRFLLVRRFHALEQRRKNIKATFPDNLLIEERLTKQMVDIMLDVALLGGIPKSWAERIG